ncbi:N-acetylmuramoyl-L-alanine amidase-like domain-containing protein [uncultured Draconibacterium sp.]|uniref:N-acetylmuramoyl-L-alanine amidase-like domain-containing protein n=1 Tax=uncultured Draconibacterium sp. TaxID=1573823 RepID=UPI003216A0E4
MRQVKTIFLALFLLCSYYGQSQIKFEPEDKKILQNIFSQFENKKELSTAELVALVGKYFIETPYVASTLETEPEQLVINLCELDCTTYAENCLAIARILKSGQLTFESFKKELMGIRYRDGIVNGYPSRLHYFSDWIYVNEEKGLLKQVSKEIANTPYPLNINFMSTHPDSYKQLETNPGFVSPLKKTEAEISSRKMFFIPKDKIAGFEKQMHEGDIIGLTTSIKGLDITHVGILVKKNERIHLMHASSKAEKVVISENTLEEYLAGRKTVNGIMVVRPN